MTNSLASHRSDDYRVDLLNLDGDLVHQLDGVEYGGEITLNVAADVRGTGRLEIVTDRPRINWLDHLVRVWYVGAGMEVPLLTGEPHSPRDQHTATHISQEVALYDATDALNTDSFGGFYGVPAGVNIIDQVRQITESTGLDRMILEPSPATLAASMTWEPDTSKLRVVNDLLYAAGYWAIYADPLGWLRGEPYTPPERRPVAWPFDRLYLPDWSRTLDTRGIPNRVVCIQRVEGDETPLEAERVLDDIAPDSWNTVARRKRQRTKVYDDVDAANQEVLQSICDRYLLDAQRVAEVREFTHPWLPTVGPNTVVEHEHPRADRVRAVVQKQIIRVETGGLCTSTVRGLV